MNELGWLICNDPDLMLQYLHGKASDRKLRLFCVACCRRIWHLMNDRICRKAVVAAEGHADGLVTDTKLRQAHDAIWMQRRIRNLEKWTEQDRSIRFDICNAATCAARSSEPSGSAILCARHASEARWVVEWVPEFEAQSILLRDIFGNPFRPVTIDPTWLTPTVLAVATGIYEDRSFETLPVLADALREADCEDAALLSHLEDPDPHARGCWALDMILGRS